MLDSADSAIRPLSKIARLNSTVATIAMLVGFIIEPAGDLLMVIDVAGLGGILGSINDSGWFT